MNLDSQRLVKTSNCENFGIRELNSKVDGLVKGIYDEDQIFLKDDSIISNKRLTDKEIISNPKYEENLKLTNKKKEISKIWHYTAGSITVVSALLSYQAASSYNSLSNKNQQLANSYSKNGSSATRSEYENNQSTMKGYKSQVQTFDLISLIGLGWYAYLFFDDELDLISEYQFKNISILANYEEAKLIWNRSF